MTAPDPLDRPAAADVEAALRHALVSPDSLPGPIREEHTRVLPAPVATNALSAPRPSLPAVGLGAHGLPGTGARPHRASRATPWFRQARLRTRLAVVLAALAVLAGAGAFAFAVAVAPPAAPAVVPYPTVTGPLGEHLKELQKSVEP